MGGVWAGCGRGRRRSAAGARARGLARSAGTAPPLGLRLLRGARLADPGGPSMAVEEEGLRVFQSVKIKIGELPGTGGAAESSGGSRRAPPVPNPFAGVYGPGASRRCALPGCGPLLTPGEPTRGPLPSTRDAQRRPSPRLPRGRPGPRGPVALGDSAPRRWRPLVPGGRVNCSRGRCSAGPGSGPQGLRICVCTSARTGALRMRES